MIKIPHQLNNPEFRFIKLRNSSKRPFEKFWTCDTLDEQIIAWNKLEESDKKIISLPTLDNFRLTNYKYSEILEWTVNENYGVKTGYGGLTIIDCDKLELQQRVLSLLPQTFTIQTGSGGTHFYFICKDLDKKIIVQNINGHYGEVQHKGQQIVCPGSMHPNGNIYNVLVDVPIVEITKAQIVEVVRPLIPPEMLDIIINGKFNQPRLYNDGESEMDRIRIENLINISGFARHGDELQGPHPIHGSTTGVNFSINTKKNLWRCWRCQTGGGIFSFFAMINDIVKCEECV